MSYEIIQEAIHPSTGELYKIGDRVVIYQGRFGHNNIITINSMFKSVPGDGNVYVSDNTYSAEDYKKVFPHNPTGTYLSSVKSKMSDKEFAALQRAKSLVNKYN